MNAGKRGFTLVEVMIIVVILGILSGVAIPKIGQRIRGSAESETKGSLSILRSALLIYFADNIGVDVSSFSALIPKYIASIPTAKLGTYHNNSDSVINVNTYGTSLDNGGWYYVTSTGDLYVNCTHADTKDVIIANW